VETALAAPPKIGKAVRAAVARTPIRETTSIKEAPKSGAPTHPVNTGIVEPAPAVYHAALLSPEATCSLFEAAV